MNHLARQNFLSVIYCIDVDVHIWIPDLVTIKMISRKGLFSQSHGKYESTLSLSHERESWEMKTGNYSLFCIVLFFSFINTYLN